MRNIKIDELVKFIKASVNDLARTDNGATYKFELDEDFAIYVGWGDGFSATDEDYIHSKKQPTYCVCIKVAQNCSYFSWEDAYMPWCVDDDEVYDTDFVIFVDEDYKSLAVNMLHCYKDMRELFDNGEITF